MRITPTVITALLLTSACVGGVEDVDNTNPTPDAGTTPTAKEGQTIYVRDVAPIVAMKCSGAGCHTQSGATGMYGFAIADGTSSYMQVTSVPILVGTYTATSAAILSKITPDGAHKTMTYSADDTSKITAWLAQEAIERNDGTQPPPIDPVAKLRDWSGCMSLTNFTAANMPQAWGNLATSDLRRCANCHGGGAYAFMSGTGNADIFFNTITTQKDLLLKYFTVDSTGKVVINTAAFQSAGVTLDGHPRFNATTNAGMTALQKFYDDTLARQAAGQATCDPARLPL